jgi:hypothetical protein
MKVIHPQDLIGSQRDLFGSARLCFPRAIVFEGVQAVLLQLASRTPTVAETTTARWTAFEFHTDNIARLYKKSNAILGGMQMVPIAATDSRQQDGNADSHKSHDETDSTGVFSIVQISK